MSQITTVIFDMYETLVENNPGLWQSTFQEIIRSQQLQVSIDDLWREWRAVEVGFRSRRVEPGSPFQSYFEGWRDCFAGAFQILGLEGDPETASHKSIQDMSLRAPYVETIEAMKAIQKNWRTAILSNADDGYLLPNVAALDLNFAEVLSSEGCRAYKPEPSLFQEMLRRLGVSPSEAMYVGDRQYEDVQGASGVGMPTVWINRTEAELDPKLPTPDYQIASLLELPGILTGKSTGQD
jgi:2-haloalkanoic acid dehalogenase type II